MVAPCHCRSRGNLPLLFRQRPGIGFLPETKIFSGTLCAGPMVVSRGAFCRSIVGRTCNHIVYSITDSVRHGGTYHLVGGLIIYSAPRRRESCDGPITSGVTGNTVRGRRRTPPLERPAVKTRSAAKTDADASALIALIR